jgi:hypothetical protein
MPRIKRYALAVRKCRRGVIIGLESLAQQIKKWPRKSRPLVESRGFDSHPEAKAETLLTLDSQASEAETGEVAVADRDLRALHQKAVDGGQQTAKQGA